MKRTELTPELIEAIAKDVKDGNFIEPAARRHGVRHSTLYNWLAKGRELLAAQDDSTRVRGTYAELATRVRRRAKHGERDRLCMDLVDALEKAEADAEVRVVAIVHDAMPKNWPAAFRWLESRARDRWLRVERQEITGSHEAPVDVQSPAERINAEADRIAARLLSHPVPDRVASR